MSTPVRNRPNCETRRGKQRYVALPQSVCRSVQPDRVQPRIAGEHLQGAARRRVALLDSLYVAGQGGSQALPDLGETLHRTGEHSHARAHGRGARRAGAR